MVYCRIIICEVDFAPMSLVISPGNNSINLAIWPPPASCTGICRHTIGLNIMIETDWSRLQMLLNISFSRWVSQRCYFLSAPGHCLLVVSVEDWKKDERALLRKCTQYTTVWCCVQVVTHTNLPSCQFAWKIVFINQILKVTRTTFLPKMIKVSGILSIHWVRSLMYSRLWFRTIGQRRYSYKRKWTRSDHRHRNEETASGF